MTLIAILTTAGFIVLAVVGLWHFQRAAKTERDLRAELTDEKLGRKIDRQERDHAVSMARREAERVREACDRFLADEVGMESWYDHAADERRYALAFSDEIMRRLPRLDRETIETSVGRFVSRKVADDLLASVRGPR